jgi:beta-phosphoglucomutase-like phosphatase (HAD superfamily)
MKYKAFLFGSIGTIIETSEIQRQSFNDAFKEAGLDWYWNETDYKNLLQKSGGAKRIEDFAQKNNFTVDASKIRLRKTELFNKYLIDGNFEPREGVLDIINCVKDNGLKLGFVTSTTINNINAVFFALKNFIQKSDFDFIGNNNLIDKPKPNAEIYYKALDVLSMDTSECIAIEDTEESVKSSLDAKIKCIGFPGNFHLHDSFDQCEMKVTKLDLSILN